MAKHFDIPQAPTTYTYTFTDFLGVDYNNPFDSDIRHSPKMLNMILENGYLKKRHGLKIKLFITNPAGDVRFDAVIVSLRLIKHCVFEILN